MNHSIDTENDSFSNSTITQSLNGMIAQSVGFSQDKIQLKLIWFKLIKCCISLKFNVNNVTSKSVFSRNH